MIQTPHFLIGSERSGTTLLRLMLDHHPLVAFNLESEYLVSQMRGLKPPDMQAYHNWLAQDRVFAHSRFTIDTALSYDELVNDFLVQKRDRNGKRLVGATVHRHFDRLPSLWPDAKYIYLLRDGRDVARSSAAMGWFGNAWTAATIWLEAEQTWEAMRPRLRDEQWIELRYEDLLADPRRELDRVCRFMGVAFSERMFDYVDGSTYTLPDVKLAQQWKRNAPRREVQYLEARLGPRLRQRGYELSGHPPIIVTPLRRTLLRLDGRVRALAKRGQKFGWTLTVQMTLARVFGLRRWRAALQRRMDEKTDQQLA